MKVYCDELYHFFSFHEDDPMFLSLDLLKGKADYPQQLSDSVCAVSGRVSARPLPVLQPFRAQL